MPYPGWPLFVLIGLFAIGFVSMFILIMRLFRFMPASSYGNPDAGFALFARMFVDENLRTERLLFFISAGAGALFILLIAVVVPMVVPVVGGRA